MVFSRIFGKQPDRPAGPPPEPDEESQAMADADDVADVAEDSRPEDWSARARRVIPRGASTGSKRVDALFGTPDGTPTHFIKAAGCHLVTTENETLLDCTMALGSVALGYAEPRVTRAIIEALANGSVAGLSPALEVEVAERFCGMIPCAERVQFVKTGAEAVSAAVRVARTYTGRDLVIGCGYFGWHDWWSDKPGVPAGTRQHFRAVPFDDVAALESAVSEAGQSLAAVVLEPVIERLPSKAWVARARQLCSERGAVLVFDELKTGFRIATGGYQQYAEITPDLAAFGKAMGNGYPIAAFCGSAVLMEAVDKTWISSTLASEAGGLAAVGAVLQWYDQAEICESLWSTGREMRQVVTDALAASGLEGVRLDGIDPMWFFRFDDAAVETAFLLAAARHGVLFKRGAYNFSAMAHDEDAIREIESGASAAFVELRENAR